MFRSPAHPLPQVVLAVLMATAPLDASGQTVGATPKALTALLSAAQDRSRGAPRGPLGAPSSPALMDIDGLEPAGSGRTPNDVRALASVAGAPRSWSTLVRTMLYDGLVEPEVKMAMGLRVAQLNASPYVAAHAQRWLRATPRGRALLDILTATAGDTQRAGDRLALRYAASLTLDVHGVTDEDFARVRGAYNDGQVVELTMVVSFFNYFTRMAEALRLPVEPWVWSAPFAPPATPFLAPPARVNLMSDRQLDWASSVVPAVKTGEARPPLVNSQRAMMLTPAIGTAWMNHMRAVGASSGVSQALKLHVSFAVSTANGCRYCTLHQVQGLRRQGISIEKLLALQKDDRALTPRERVAVEFARALTRGPASITDADYDRLRTTFGDQGALEVVLQTCAFAFMNRFTDNLKLPSEDEAVAVYREVYGRDAPPAR